MLKHVAHSAHKAREHAERALAQRVPKPPEVQTRTVEVQTNVTRHVMTSGAGKAHTDMALEPPPSLFTLMRSGPPEGEVTRVSKRVAHRLIEHAIAGVCSDETACGHTRFEKHAVSCGSLRVSRVYCTVRCCTTPSIIRTCRLTRP